MKTKLFLLTVLVASAAVLSSCTKKNDTTTGGSNVTHADSYTINGAGFKNAPYFISNISSQSCTFSAPTTTIAITGAFGDSVDIRFDIGFNGSAAGTYSLGSTSAGGNYMEITTTSIANPNNLTIYTSSNAKLVVTSYGASGGQITGTFSGSFVSGVGIPCTITGGTFTAIVQ